MSQYLFNLQPFLLWLGLSLAYSGVFFALYLWITPQHELRMIREGNVSAAVCLSGTVLGYVLPLASAMVHGTNLIDFSVWALIAMLVQIAVYLALRVSMKHLTQDIIEDRVSVAILVAALSVAAGVLNAAALFE